MEEEKNRKITSKQIFIGVLSVILILVIGLMIWIYNQTSPSGELDDLKKAVHSKDYQDISKHLSSSKYDISDSDIERLTKYIHKDIGLKNFDKQINQLQKSSKKENKDGKVGQIKDKHNQVILTVTNDGKKLFFVDKIHIEPIYHSVYIKEADNTASYQFENHDSSKDIKAKGNETTEIGEFIVGKYDVETTKELEEGSMDGQLTIDTSKKDKDKKIIAQQDFKQAQFKTEVSDAGDIDKDSLKINIDGKDKTYKEGKVYGYFPIEQTPDIYIKGDFDGETYKTNVRSIPNTNGVETLQFKFNQDAINKHKAKNKRIENKAKGFMKDYTEALNKAYKSSNFDDVSDYFVPNTDTANHIKKKVESKQKSKFKDGEVSNIKKDQSTINLVYKKKDEKNRQITSEYELQYDDKKEEFKIKSYQDVQ